MKKPFKCEYCGKRPSTIHNDELLCSYHYNHFYGTVLSNSAKKIDVHKTSEEQKLHEYYMHILENYNFKNPQKSRKIIKQFLNDCKAIATQNAIYHKVV